MQEIINSLKALPKSAKPAFESDLTTWFLLDKVRGEKTLSTFYMGENAGLINHVDYLLQNTPHAYLLEESPLLIRLSHTQLSESLYQAIQQERSGIFIQSNTTNLLEHLQYLFIMHSETQGQVYARYYDPMSWTALQLSMLEQLPTIWGPLAKVYTQTPVSTEHNPQYYTWTSPNQVNLTDKPTHALQLPTYFYEVEENIRLLYFIGEASAIEGITIPEDQLTHTILNIKILVRNGIQQGEHLQKLLYKCMTDKQFGLNESVQAILYSNLAAFEKTNQLIALA